MVSVNREVLVVSLSGAMRIPHQLVLQSVPRRPFTIPVTLTTQATLSEPGLLVSNVVRKGIGRETVPFLHRMLLLSREEDLLLQAHAINVVRLGTGQGTALLFRL